MITRHFVRSVTIALATVLAITSCGIPLDESPRALQTPSDETTNQPTDPDEGEAAAAIYFSNTESLAPVITNLSNSGTKSVLDALLRGVTPADADRGFVSQVPAGTELLSSSVEDSQVSINLSEEFDNLTGAAKADAVAQIVITVTSLAGIDSVMFKVNGNDQDVFSPLQGRDVSTVTACDYSANLPNEEKANDLGLTQDELTALLALRDRLRDTCES